MNREIKFRVWDGQMSKMHNDVFVASNLNMRFHQIFLHRAYSDFHWMQWTGLKDSNGFDIYEGDILQSKDTKIKFHVIYDCERGRFRFKDHLIEIYENLNILGVIGNVCENPELIKE